MSVTSRTKNEPQFTSMAEMKQWIGEREDRLHSEHVRERILQRAAERAERESKKQQSANPKKAIKKSPK